MSGSRFFALLAAVVAIIAVVALGLYLYQREPVSPQTADTPAPQTQAEDTAKTPSSSTTVPSFDVVRIEPSGDGVMAGQAQPGWSVKIASGGKTLAETKADDEGDWTIVLEEPLPQGDHELMVTATSPDGASTLSAQQSVKVAVGEAKDAEVAALPQDEAPASLDTAESSVDAAPAQGPAQTYDGEIPGDKSRIAKSESEGAATPADQAAAAYDGETPGDKSLIQSQTPPSDAPAAAPTASAEAPATANGEIPGDKSLIQSQMPPSDAPAAAAPTASAEAPATANGEIPGDKSLIEPPAETAAPEPSGTDSAPAKTANGTGAAEAEPEAVQGQPEPVIAPPPPGGTVHRPKPPVVFKTVDYQDVGPDSGKLTAGGTGDPGATVLFYFDEKSLGQTTITGDGKWTFEADVKLEPGDHTVLAEIRDEGSGMATGRASISMRRVQPEPEVATVPPAPPAPSAEENQAATPTPEPAPSTSTTEPETPQVAATEPDEASGASRRVPDVYSIKRGDTLWDLAEQYLGGGWRYKKIARQNRNVIRNPHRIWPDQQVRIPQP